MSISVSVITDSISPSGKRISTLLLRYPRFIHAELMTHRKFSRNASSSRAIPVRKIIADIMADPAIPMHWGKNIPGMQAHEQIDEKIDMFPDCVSVLSGELTHVVDKEEAWLTACDACIQVARGFDNAGYHKQIVNRLLEPWSHINVLVTATDFANFFHLRSHKDAQPEIRILSDMMRLELSKSQPFMLEPGEWHLPFVRIDDITNARNYAKHQRITRDEPSEKEITDLLLRISSARCARTSYLLHDGVPTTIEKDLSLYNQLVGSQPLHASPTEHQATPDAKTRVVNGVNVWDNPELHGNFDGWIQFRKTLPGEYYPG